MPCNLNQLASDGTQFQNLPRWKFEVAKVYMLALLLDALGGEDVTDLTALTQDMRQYGRMTESDLQAAYLQALYVALSATDVPPPSQAQIDAVLRVGQCVPIDLLRKAEVCVLSLLTQEQGG